MMIAADWSGSAAQRREQGICRPPSAVKLVYVVRAGTRAKAKRRRSKYWRFHVVKRDCRLGSPISQADGRMVFHECGWLLSVPADLVQVQEVAR